MTAGAIATATATRQGGKERDLRRSDVIDARIAECVRACARMHVEEEGWDIFGKGQLESSRTLRISQSVNQIRG